MSEARNTDSPPAERHEEPNNNDSPIEDLISSAPETREGGSYTSETTNLEKMILSTGIRVGTPVKTKYMTQFIVRANPEGLYILDISKTLAKIDVAAKFIGRANISKVAITSAREYGKTLLEKFCELTGAKVYLEDLCQAHSQIHLCQSIWNQRS